MTKKQAIEILNARKSERFEMADGSRQAEPLHANERVFASGWDTAIEDAIEALDRAGAFQSDEQAIEQARKVVDYVGEALGVDTGLISEARFQSAVSAACRAAGLVKP